MKIISRYIAKIYLQFLVMTLFALLLLVVISQLFGTIGEVFNEPSKFLKFLDTLVRSLPLLVNLLLPMTVLLATVFTFNNLGRSSELVALKSLGFSYYRCLRPVLVLMVLVAGVSYFNAHYLHVWLNPSADGAHIITDQWQAGEEGYVYYRKSDRAAGTVQDVVVYRADREGPNLSGVRIIPHMARDASGAWEVGAAILRRMKSGNWVIREQPAGAQPFGAFPDPFRQAEVDGKHMPVLALWAKMGELKALGLDTAMQKLELFRKLAALFAPFALAIFAAPLAQSHFRKSGASLDVMICVLGGLVFLVSTEIMMALGRGGYVPALVATWTVNAVFLALGLFLATRNT